MYMYSYNKRQQFCITSTGSTEVQKAASKIATMFYPRVALITLTLLGVVTFINCFRCDVLHPEENCLTLWTAFQKSLLTQYNLLRIDLMFNQPSQLTPTVVKVIYNYSITGLNHRNSTCVDKNGSVVLGWTAKSLYIYFHVSLINQLQFQLPFLIIKYFEGSELREEPDVDDYLWVGYDQTSLPELYLTLDVTFTPENNTLKNGCPSNEDITNALGELNHWLRAFAKVALQGTEAAQSANPDYKGYTLPQSGVEPYNYNESNKDPNEALGQQLFFCVYFVKAVITYIIGIFLYRELLEVYDSEVGRDRHFPSQFFTVTFLASVHIGLLYLTDMGYYWYNWNNLNVFTCLKVVFITMPIIGWVLLITVYYCKSNTLRSNTKALCLRRMSFWDTISSHWRNITRVVLVGLLTHAIVLLILSVFPTLLLFFAHPLNNFTLLLIHVTLFYIETIIGMLVIEQLQSMCIQKLLHKCCKREHNKGGFIEQACKSKQYNKLLSMAQNTCSICICIIIINGVVLLIGFAVIILLIVYILVMWSYHILFLRSLINNLAFKYFIKYIPSVIIGVFGYMYLIQKGTFSDKKKEDKNEEERPKLEEPSNISDDHSDTCDVGKKRKYRNTKETIKNRLKSTATMGKTN